MRNILFLLLITPIVACGVSTTNSNIKIVGGLEIKGGSWISKVTVSILDEFTRRSFCTGTLISTNEVLTAAHCIQQLTENSRIGIGLTSLDSDTIEIKQALTHPDYDESQLEIDTPTHAAADIGLIVLASEVPKSMTTATLANSETPLYVSTEITLAGFGLAGTQPSWGRGVLRSVATEVTSVQSEFKEFTYGHRQGKSGCAGDSGGPAFIDQKNSLILIGIISRGETLCGESGINTDVRPYLAWIRNRKSSLNQSN